MHTHHKHSHISRTKALKMQAVAVANVAVAPLSANILTPKSSGIGSLRSILRGRTSQCPPLKATPSSVQDPSTVDYTSSNSVFPAEACETLGGEACDAEIYPETKLEPETKKPSVASELVDREYLEYNNSKTVFPGEACDDLGGEFCEPDYQKGVYQ